MASREIRDLSPATQVLWNKFHDRCRRDTVLLKMGVTVMLTCTYRATDEQERLGLSTKARLCVRGTDGKPSSHGFEILTFEHCRPTGKYFPVIDEHAKAVGLIRKDQFYYEAP